MKRILHVTEALGGGVLHAISQLTQLQARDGYEVILAHSVRSIDTPSHEVLNCLFPFPIRRIVVPMATQVAPKQDIAVVLHLMYMFERLQPDVIHLHSSKAGVLGRLAARLSGNHHKIFYSPHGFSFLRQDVSSFKRSLFRHFERIAAKFGGTLLACSQSEENLARTVIGRRAAILVENCIDLRMLPSPGESRNLRARVVTSGRICSPKAPANFRRLAVALKGRPAHFVWIGDGAASHDLRIDGNLPSNLAVTGWLEREQVYQELSRSDIFVLLSLWEGMPLALIEAQASGLPAVVTDVAGCRDVVKNGVTGFVCKDMDEVIEKVELLLNDKALRMKMGENARLMAAKRFSMNRMHQETLAAYGLAAAQETESVPLLELMAS